MKVKIISDSTCDLSPELVKKYDISIVPLYVVMGDKIRKDGVRPARDLLFSTPAKWLRTELPRGKSPRNAAP